MSSELFISIRQQEDKCGICLSDDANDLKELGSIVNHLVDKHPGFHAKCLKVWLSIQQACPVCKQALNPNSFYVGENQIKYTAPEEIIQNNLKLLAAILLIFFTVIGGAVYTQNLDFRSGAISFCAILQLGIIGCVSRVLAQTIQEQLELSST